jgi:hypothetical protein
MASSLVQRCLVRVAGDAALGVAAARVGAVAGEAAGAVAVGATPVGGAAAGAAAAAAVKSGFRRLRRRAVAAVAGEAAAGATPVGAEAAGEAVVGNFDQRSWLSYAQLHPLALSKWRIRAMAVSPSGEGSRD